MEPRGAATEVQHGLQRSSIRRGDAVEEVLVVAQCGPQHNDGCVTWARGWGSFRCLNLVYGVLQHDKSKKKLSLATQGI